MKKIKNEITVYAQALLFFCLWALILFITNTKLIFNFEALKKLPDVVASYTVLYLIFSKFLWRFPIFKGWLVPFPDLQGTWHGKLKTTWVDPETGDIPVPVPIKMVIRQSYDSINCVMYSEESVSTSNTAQIVIDEESGIKQLTYNYTNKTDATIRDRSAMHDGAAVLRIILKPKKELVGEYWTSRKTMGKIRLKFKTKELEETIHNK